MTQFPVLLYNVPIMTLCVIIQCAYISHLFHVMALYVIIWHYCRHMHYMPLFHWMALYVIICHDSAANVIIYAIISWCHNVSLSLYAAELNVRRAGWWSELDVICHNMSQYAIICQYIPLYVLISLYVIICHYIQNIDICHYMVII
jgi:hypothetical protein